MRWVRALAVPALMLMLGACGGGPATQASTGSEASDDAESSVEASVDAGSSAEASTGGNGGDYEAVAESLIPPNSTEVTKTTTAGYSYIIYSSTDSMESLTSHYESAIPATGMTIFSTTNASGTVAWVFAESEGSTLGGSVSLYPSGTGDNTTAVAVAVGDSN